MVITEEQLANMIFGSIIETALEAVGLTLEDEKKCNNTCNCKHSEEFRNKNLNKEMPHHNCEKKPCSQNRKIMEPVVISIVDVIYNKPATIVKWSDGTKTVVVCEKGDTYSRETGLALCINKKIMGNKMFRAVFEKWCPEIKEPAKPKKQPAAKKKTSVAKPAAKKTATKSTAKKTAVKKTTTKTATKAAVEKTTADKTAEVKIKTDNTVTE